ncbi:hypothetical protein [Paenibacillus antarcticus]|uniref:Uncharacterized protein n=1 Tax=Paenibacillus antarcticus TaxID=253703 RepID=A0A168J900_9BACL|nr:hypothetical protein [Paenibacillus antarcticus]OAB40306.1 hypothetical protein PBAT_23670 [Paenibacillus antarcticus]
MFLITPMTEEGIRPHVGKRVCAMLCDGSYYHGTITDIRDGHLILNGQSNPKAAICSSKKMKSNLKKAAQSASISAYYPGYRYGFGAGAGLALSLGLLALLFLI